MPTPFPWLNPAYSTPTQSIMSGSMVAAEYNAVSYSSVVQNRTILNYYKESNTAIVLSPDAETVAGETEPYFNEDYVEVIVWNWVTGDIDVDDTFLYTIANGKLLSDSITNQLIVLVDDSEEWGLTGNCIIQLVENSPATKRVLMEHRMRLYPSVL